MDNRAIGVFDSGLGGLTAVRQLHRAMPNESIIYFGDTGRVPYGSRSRRTVLKYARQETKKKAAAIQRAVGESFSPGDRVSHDKFGEGTVVEATDKTVRVEFADETRKLALGFAPIKKI